MRSGHNIWCGVDYVARAESFGIDVSQLRDNLAMTVGERLRRHQVALNTVELLRKARRINEESASSK